MGSLMQNKETSKAREQRFNDLISKWLATFAVASGTALTSRRAKVYKTALRGVMTLEELNGACETVLKS